MYNTSTSPLRGGDENKGARGGPRAGHSCCARCARCAHCASWCFARLRRGVGDAASPLTSEKKKHFFLIRSQRAVAVGSRKVCQNKSEKWGAVDTVPHIRTHFGNLCVIIGHLWSKLYNVLYILEHFKRFCSNRFIETTLIPPTTMGRVCVQRVALYENARAARAIKREAGGFCLRDAMRVCAQRARGARRRPRPHFAVVS